MEQLFLQIMEAIKAEMPEISLIDEDYGQLETDDDTYPVTYPCVLIGGMEGDWTDVGLGAQKGQISLSVRLAVDCFADTHYGSGTESQVADFCRLYEKKGSGWISEEIVVPSFIFQRLSYSLMKLEMVFPVCCLKNRIRWFGSEKFRRKAISFTVSSVNSKAFLTSCSNRCLSR